MYTQIELCACNLFRLERVQRKTTVLLREVAKVFPHSMTQNAKCAAEKFQLNVYSCDAEKFNYRFQVLFRSYDATLNITNAI